MNIVIDNEFAALIPPLQDDEYRILEENIVRDGCRDPLVLWLQKPDKDSTDCNCSEPKWEREIFRDSDLDAEELWHCKTCDEWCFEDKGILLDGHNRLQICQNHQLKYNTTFLEFSCRDAAADWIDANQLGRRNLKPDQRTLLLGRRYLRGKKNPELNLKRGNDTPIHQIEAPIGETEDQRLVRPGKTYLEHKKANEFPKGKNCPSGNTAEILGQQYGVSPRTVKNAGQFAQAVDAVKSIDPDIEKKVAQNVAPPKAAVLAAAKYLESSPEKAKAVLNGEAKLSDIKREEQRQEHTRKIEEAKSKPKELFVSGPYDLILADPPWRYDFSETESREIENQYPTAPVSDICNQKPDSAPNSILLLWATAPKLKEALTVLSAWGFEYKTHAIWDKQKVGMGYWFRGQHELLLVGTKGSPGATPECERVSSVFSEPRGKHSAKPECVYQWIEHAFPTLKKLEMYCRSPRPGWAVWGNEI